MRNWKYFHNHKNSQTSKQRGKTLDWKYCSGCKSVNVVRGAGPIVSFALQVQVRHCTCPKDSKFYKYVNALREGFKNYLCTFCRKFYKGGEGGSAVLQVLVRIFEKKLKVLQMLQFIQKWREKNFPFIDPPSQPCLGDSIVYLSFADVTFSFQNGTEKGPRGYFLGPLWSTLGSNGGCNCNCNNTVWFEMVQCSSSASDIERCSDSAQSQSVVCFGTITGNADEIRHWLCSYLLLWPLQWTFLSVLGL